MTFASRVDCSRGDLVYLVRGKDQGRQAWYYVHVDRPKLNRFLVRIGGGSLNLEDYGKVLYKGWGNDPPGEIVAQVHAKYLS